MDNKPLFTIVFEHGESYTGNSSYRDTGWLQIPNKEIEAVFYRLPDGNHLCLKGYDQYFHMCEAVMDLMGNKKGITSIQYGYIMGRRGNIVDSYRITLFEHKDSKYKVGDIVKRQFNINSKIIKGLNPSNWRPILQGE